MKNPSKSISKISGNLYITEKLSFWILVVTIPLAIVLGVVGYLNYHEGNAPVVFSNALYHTFQLFILHTPHFSTTVPLSLEVARWLATSSTILVIINAALHFFHQELMEWKLQRSKQHIIVCGLGKKGMTVVNKLYAAKIRVVAVEKNPEPEIEERLHRMGIPLILGDATQKDILMQARVHHAKGIFALCPEDMTNCTIATEAHFLGNNLNQSRNCFIHINDAELRNVLQHNHTCETEDSIQKLQFIDAFGPEAISLLTNILPIDHNGITPTDIRQVHLILLGFGRMGQTIAVKAAQLGHFANQSQLQISVIDHTCSIRKASLLFHHPFIEKAASFTFYEQEALSPETRALLEKWCNEPNKLIDIVFCFDNQPVTYDLFFNLLPMFNQNNIRVAIRVQDTDSFTSLLREIESPKINQLKVYPFGLEKDFENLIDPGSNNDEKFAGNIHNEYIKLVKFQLKDEPEELEKRLNSGELNEWESLREDFKESNRQQALHMKLKLRACGYAIVDKSEPGDVIVEFEKDMLGHLTIMEHNRWVAERIVNNWRIGKESDKVNRINRNLVPWDQLDEQIKNFDYEAITNIPFLLNSIGKKIVAN